MKELLTKNYEWLVILLLIIIAVDATILAWDIDRITSNLYLELPQ